MICKIICQKRHPFFGTLKNMEERRYVRGSVNFHLALCGVFKAIGIIGALLKNSPPDCFYLALLGTVAFESPSLVYVKNKRYPLWVPFVFGGEKGIRTPGTVITVHMISNHAPSASSDISPITADYYNK